MEHAGNSNPYGLMAALEQGGTIAWATFLILVFMSVVSWYIMFTKVFEQQKIFNQGKAARRTFWGAPSLKDGAGKLEKNSAYRQIVDDGLVAAEQHRKLTRSEEHQSELKSRMRSSYAVFCLKKKKQSRL